MEKIFSSWIIYTIIILSISLVIIGCRADNNDSYSSKSEYTVGAGAMEYFIASGTK